MPWHGTSCSLVGAFLFFMKAKIAAQVLAPPRKLHVLVHFGDHEDSVVKSRANGAVGGIKPGELHQMRQSMKILLAIIDRFHALMAMRVTGISNRRPGTGIIRTNCVTSPFPCSGRCSHGVSM
jgi:hypothetical protein